MKPKLGRPTKYNDELVKDICNGIASSSKGTKKLCDENPHWPSQDTLFTWLKDNKEFSEQYAQAKRQQAEVLVDAMLDIVQGVAPGCLKDEHGVIVPNIALIQQARLRIDVYKWLACKLIPRIYGERTRLDADIGVTRQEDAIEMLA